MSLEAFRRDLATYSAEEVFDRWILTGSCAAIDDGVQHAIGASIAAHFEIEYREIVFVGSANLGFSIKPSRRYGRFGEDSDVDVAIVSQSLFERVWQEIYRYDISQAYWPKKGDFRKYLSRGWIRPDLLPSSDEFRFAGEWWDYFSSLQIEGCPYKIAGGIYYSAFFLREYQKTCIQQCQREL